MIVDRHIIEELGIPERILVYIRETVAWASKMCFDELVRSIYIEFPEYRENSIFPYSEEEAILDSIRRGMQDLQSGNNYPAQARLDELRHRLQSRENANSLVKENSLFKYSQNEAWLESFTRALDDYKHGRVRPARDWLDELRSELEVDSNANSKL